MKLLIDNANLEKIKKIYEYYPVDGVTCNPTILKAEGKLPIEQLTKIRKFIGPETEMHMQVVSTSAKDMIKEGIKIADRFGENTFIKIAVNEEGLKAIRELAKQGYNVTGTAVYSTMQGFLAAKAGAKVVAPYINRMDVLGYDGLKIAEEINILLKNANLDCGVIGASLKNAKQIIELYKLGVQGVTLSADLFDSIIKNQIVDEAIATFVADFESLCGKGETMLTSK